MFGPVPDGHAESIRSYAVSANYQQSWARRAAICLVTGSVVIILGVIAAAIGAVASGAVLLIIGVIVGVAGLLIRRGITSTRRHNYALTVAPDRLIVTWRDHVTELPWADLDHALVVTNGPLARLLEVAPRPGVRYVLPQNARPRMSKQHQGNLEVFILSILGERQAECLADISACVPVR